MAQLQLRHSDATWCAPRTDPGTGNTLRRPDRQRVRRRAPTTRLCPVTRGTRLGKSAPTSDNSSLGATQVACSLGTFACGERVRRATLVGCSALVCTRESAVEVNPSSLEPWFSIARLRHRPTHPARQSNDVRTYRGDVGSPGRRATRGQCIGRVWPRRAPRAVASRGQLRRKNLHGRH